MKTWYRAVCDEHKEMCDIIVNNPICGAAYLGEDAETIDVWLSMHRNCKLRLVHSDEDLEPLLGVYMDARDSALNRMIKK